MADSADVIFEVSEEELKSFRDAAVEIAKEAGEVIKDAFHKEKDIQTKSSGTDLVTETDQKVEELIISRIKEKFPSHSFIGEESVAAGQHSHLTNNPTWIVDPLDGTTNFVHRFPFVAVSIAIAVNQKPVVGVIYSCIHGNMYTAIAGQGAFCNGKKLQVSGQTELNQSQVMTEVGSRRDKEILDVVIANYKRLVEKPEPIHSMKSLGSAAINMCMVASGGADAFYEFGIHCWDIAAGFVIVQEAGGISIDPTGGPFDLMSQRVVCASSEVLARCIASNLDIVSTGRD